MEINNFSGWDLQKSKKISLLKKSNRCTTINPKAVWIHGGLDSWQFGFMTVWIHGSLDSWQFGFKAYWIHGSLDSWKFGFMAIHKTTHPPATCGLPKSKCFLCIEPLLLFKCHFC